jgi:hypothetical protein
LSKYYTAGINSQNISDFLVYCRQKDVECFGQDAAYKLAYLLGIDSRVRASQSGLTQGIRRI